MARSFNLLSLNPFFKRTWVKYAVIAILPTLALFYAPIVNYSILIFGQKALLETLPVDPTDFLRGDYVTLDYEISDLGPFAAQWEDDGQDYDGGPGREVYVSLVRNMNKGGMATVSAVSEKRPSGLYLKGRLKRSWGGDLTCDYGLGVYYIPEGTGRELEEAINDKRVLADVRILRGRGVIKKLELAE
ncbi:MAG: GDYXXLXY domain-containing protein [Synergistaceae bacterium]|jgi:uncharacterized membrane-anchored protein|nr:GDYXXLXY domain-containing protein [Synergistaceae bacterium]